VKTDACSGSHRDSCTVLWWPQKMLTSSASDYYDAASERTLAWNDSDLNIDWQLRTAPILSEKDRQGVPFRSAELFE